MISLPTIPPLPAVRRLPEPASGPAIFWPYQAPFQQGLQHMADVLFDSLDDELNPRIFLLALPPDAAAPILLEPAAAGPDPGRFRRVPGRAQELLPQGNWLLGERAVSLPDELVQNRYQSYALRLAAQEVLNELDDDDTSRQSFAGWPMPLNGYTVLVVLQLDRRAIRRHATLRPQRFYTDGRPVIPSLLHATVIRFNEECAKILNETRPGSLLLMLRPRETDEIIREAGQLLMATPAQDLGLDPGEVKLFSILNTISSLRYEGAEGVGKMILAHRRHPNIEEVFALTCPTPFSDYRAVRKLLEMTTPDVHLLADGENVYALGRQVGHYDGSREDLFTISFLTHYVWELQHDGKVLMRTSYGLPGLARPRLNRSAFRKDLKRIFHLTDAARIERLWEVVAEASRQKHGTLMVITTEALAEADRLKLQCTLIEPVHLTPLITRLITSIDGAVLLDPDGYCYSIGVILDGKATGRGTSTRGARYNSAIRYVESSPYPCLAIVVSEDGMVDVITKTEEG